MILCFDIGGTSIKGAIVHSAENIHQLPRETTPLRDFSSFVAVLKSAIAACPERPAGISFSIAGVMDPETGVASASNIACIHGRQLEADLRAEIDLPMVIANDADCFAVAEAMSGAGVGHEVVFGAILGTGIGGGLVVNGRLINARGGFAGEWGHGPVLAQMAGDPPVAIPRLSCACGQVGCVDTFGGARGLERLHHYLHEIDLTAEGIFDAWQQGDAASTRTLQIFTDLLAAPLALVVNVTGATIVPVGGGMSLAAGLIEALDEKVRARTLRRFERPLVVKAECGLEPGLIGAALNGLQRLAHG